ncbi:MAG: TonB-dependent receptor [Ekhidna sp.]|nr:TonB-dependent receptor [Ekhidna sp.]MBC6409620.1 TonB-dependent receptor [Ekhidna sp.]MBC6426689.1 TonB-dependent receptor [Ekhidna sp.]
MKKWTYIIAFIPLIGFSQHEINGLVSYQDEGLPGATVQIVDTQFGAITDPDGSFVLSSVPKGSYTLEVRSLGFKIQKQSIEVPVSNLLSIQLEESALTMDEVVVTGTMQPAFVSASPVKVDVVTSRYLDTFTPSAATGVIEGVGLINGVREVVACGVCFTNNISINGLPGPYTAVLMDGTPIYGNLASVYGLNGIPSMIIDRFEVIKGPSSTLYGSEAVAGVINIITKNPEMQPKATIDMMGTSHYELFGNLSIAPEIGNSNGFVGVNYAYINNFDDENEDGFGDNINMDRISLFSKWNLSRPSDRQFTVSAKYFYEDRRNGVEEFLADRNYRELRGNDQIYGESIYTHRAELFGTYELGFAENLRVDYSLSRHEQNSYYGSDYYKASQHIFFTNLIWQKDLTDHSITGGFTSRYQTYDDNTIATIQNGINQPERQYIPGVFVQDEWSLSEKFTLLGGVRFDHYEEHGVIFSPRLNAKYKPGNRTTVRSNFGTGFRIVNLFTEDHAFVTGQREVIIEENLQPEKSYNVSLNLNHLFTIGESQGMVDIDAFHTYFTNKITPDYENDKEIRYANTDGYAISKGIGLNIRQEFAFPLSFNAGMSFQEVTETEKGETRAIEFAPQWTGVFTLDYHLKRLDTSFGCTASITGPMALPEVFDLDAEGKPLPVSRPTSSRVFGIHNLHLSTSLNDNLSIYGGIQNILNYMQPWSPLTGTNDPNARSGFSDSFDTAYAYAPIHGREFYLGITWKL